MRRISHLLMIVMAMGGLLLGASEARAQRLMEKLGRGVIAVNEGGGKVFVSWRLLGDDPERIAFNLYRKADGGEAVKLNKAPLAGATNFVDENVNTSQTNAWFVRPVLDGKELEACRPWTLKAGAPVRQYLEIPVRTPQGYRPNDASVGDLDGDGEYEIVLHQSGRGIDTPSRGFSDIPVFQAYKLDGTFLWEIILGKNIREGAHYTQFMVADLDGDGKAEFCCKTADGTVDGEGKAIGDASKDWRDRNGKILAGPEYFTVFSGATGKALATTAYIPPRGDLGGWGGVGGNGRNDRSGNRVDRFLACVAWLDGRLPSVVMCRGYYGRSVLAAWDWRGGKLTSRWVFDTDKGYPKFAGMGNHNLSVADVDGDGKDEIIYGSMCVDHDGKGLYTTGLRHGDALHVSDLDPARPGLEVWGVHENEEPVRGYENGFGAAMYDARTGEIIFGVGPGRDVGRGVAADIDPRRPGAEMWGGPGGLHDVHGETVGPAPRTTNFIIYWDGDPLSELLNGNRITKWDWLAGKEMTIFTAEGCQSNNGSKSDPCLSADILGDWREELIERTENNKAIRIYTTTIPTEHRMYTLMHDPVYRCAIAWQNVGYNQPPHVGFFMDAEMKQIPRPKIVTDIKALK